MTNDEYFTRCRERGAAETTDDLSLFDNKTFRDLSYAIEWVASVMEVIKLSRDRFPVRHPVIEVIWTKTGRAKYRVELTPAGEVIKTPLI